MLLFVLMQVIVPAKTNPRATRDASLRAVSTDGAAAGAGRHGAIVPRLPFERHDVALVQQRRAGVVARRPRRERGPREFNMSEFGTWEPKKQQRKLEDACEQVKDGEMPMWIYTLQHPDAKLQPGDVELICSAVPAPGPAASPALADRVLAIRSLFLNVTTSTSR